MIRSLLAGAMSLLLLCHGSGAETVVKLVEVLPSAERTTALEAVIRDFEATHPSVRVVVTSLAWSSAFEKLATMVSAGDLPDVVEMPDRWLSVYAGTGRLENLEPYLTAWNQTGALSDRTLAAARAVDGTAYILPYGFYLRALFYNKRLFRQAGIEGPPRTLDEFMTAAKAVSALPGKSGYCLRGGPGGLSSWLMFGATAAGSAAFFKPDGTSTLSEPGWIDGTRFVIDLYRNGGAPKDSVNWGFNEVLAGFYSGTCAMLDQDPDALAVIEQHMDADDFGVATMPKGATGRAYPSLGYGGWAMFRASRHKDLAWQLIASLEGPAENLAWNQRMGTLPVYKAANRDRFFKAERFAAWFSELNDSDVTPLVLPTDLPGFGYFADVVAVRSGQQALLGQITPEDLNRQWATALTGAKAKQQPAP